MNIIIAAVGGQGAVLASRVIGQAALATGYDVKISEVHGMSQRGGSVVTFIRYDSHVASPVIEKGTADFVLGFELLEGARYVHYLRAQGTIICNMQRIEPMTVITNTSKYPTDLIEEMEKFKIDVHLIDAQAVADTTGSRKTVNMVLLGALAKMTDISYDRWIRVIEESVPPHYHDANLQAFKAGFTFKD